MTALETWAVVYHEGRADTLGEETRALYDQPRAECYLGRTVSGPVLSQPSTTGSLTAS